MFWELVNLGKLIEKAESQTKPAQPVHDLTLK